ncbi:hypothetical protein ACFQ6V_09130 [Streptomyces roseifaciens]
MNWQRRLTPVEFAAHLEWEQQRRERAAQLADPQQPPPDFGPLPQPEGCTTTVFACADHAVTLEVAALIHQGTCTAPSLDDLPGCNCAPEPAAPSTPEPGTAPADALPPGWSTGR